MHLKIIYVALFIFLNSAAFGEGNRYIVFFAESPDILLPVVDKMLLSERFCMTVPTNPIIGVPENLEKLVSCKKIESAVSLSPEPVLPVLAMFSGVKSERSGRQSIFEEYISSNLNNFEINTNTNRNAFGIFLNFAEVSHKVLYYFAGLSLPWINADNIEENIVGAYDIYGVTVFSLYKNFPYNQKDIIKWLETKHENIIPVLLTKKHLQDVKFMEYLIDFFDNSRYIKPAMPLYITEVEKNMLQQRNVRFKQFPVNIELMEKLYSAVSLINNYADFPDFKEYAYNNAKSELIYLCSLDLLRNASADKAGGKGIFDAIFRNIYHLLGAAYPENKKSDNSLHAAVQAEKRDISVSDGQSVIDRILDGIAIYNKGLLKLIKVVSENNSIKINLYFEDKKWSESIAFIDFYIDLNNVYGVGATSLLEGVNGFLAAESGWEYALRIYKNKAVLYKYSSDGVSIVSDLLVNDASVLIPQKYIRGNPVNWGYQAVIVSEVDGKKIIADFLNQSAKTKKTVLSERPFQLSAVRLRK
ncbi:hypothetical protein [Candidatus Endomicrobiellum trichonymphae]|uniref:Uncharacterized protein n=1 Tax=Endomicrobium trichonymphae TaxID=1408204 RepID=B1GYQ0_ENDTX|nr:hypothetical protein [Candidatus Endomicrobium trichonymphae]BAG14143.1 hypothetical protein TGRD_650 [Candidatus Endomicrobium trichonymphae]